MQYSCHEGAAAVAETCPLRARTQSAASTRLLTVLAFSLIIQMQTKRKIAIEADRSKTSV